MEVHITLHSAKALKKSKLSTIMRPYVRISIDGYPKALRTNTDREHGTNPVWEFGLKLELQQPYQLDSVVLFEIMHNSSTQIDRSMGQVKVPLKHFMSGDVEHGNYPVQLSSGDIMGELGMSYLLYVVSPAHTTNTADGDQLLAELPTLEVPNSRPRPSTRLSFDGIRLVASCFSIYEEVTDMIAHI